MKIIFFTPKILRNSHRFIYGLDRLEAEGYDFTILDSTIFYGNRATTNDKLILRQRFIIKENQDFDQFYRSLPMERVLYVIKDHDLNYSSRELKKIIRSNDIVLSCNTKTFAMIGETPRWRRFIEGVVRKTDNVLPLYYLKHYYKILYRIPLPKYYLCSTSFLLPLKAYLTVKPSNRFSVHADDMNHIITDSNEKIIKEGEKIAVFIDQGIPFLHETHPGVYSKPLPEDYFDNYYSNLVRTFSHVEETYNIDKVVVALHPNTTVYEKKLQNKFPGIETFIGKTKELIQCSDLVLAHNSTSINFAIYFEKPVLILKDEVIYNYHLRIKGLFDFYTNHLNMNSINIDRNLQDQQPVAAINQEKYQLYKKRFIKDNNIRDNSYYYAIKKIFEKEIEP